MSDYERAKAARDEQDRVMRKIETANCAALRVAVEAVLKQHEGKPGVEALIAAYRDAEKNAPKTFTASVTTRRAL